MGIDQGHARLQYSANILHLTFSHTKPSHWIRAQMKSNKSLLSDFQQQVRDLFELLQMQPLGRSNILTIEKTVTGKRKNVLLFFLFSSPQ
jgi:hypothetical protein